MSQSLVRLLTFELADQRFGIPAVDVQEVARAVSLSRLPKAPQIVEGVINFRGTAIPVLDIRARFKLPAKPVRPSDHLIVARAGPRVVAIRVDSVVDLLTISRSDIDSVASITPKSDYIAGVARLPNDIVLIHELATFLSAAEAADLDMSVGELRE